MTANKKTFAQLTADMLTVPPVLKGTVPDAPIPAVTVKAAYSKHRRDDVLPLRSDTAETLRGYLAAKLPKAPVFRMPYGRKGAKLLRADLHAAGMLTRRAGLPTSTRSGTASSRTSPVRASNLPQRGTSPVIRPSL